MLQLLAFCNHCLLVTEENMTYVHSGSLIWHSSIHHVSISEKYLHIYIIIYIYIFARQDGTCSICFLSNLLRVSLVPDQLILTF